MRRLNNRLNLQSRLRSKRNTPEPCLSNQIAAAAWVAAVQGHRGAVACGCWFHAGFVVGDVSIVNLASCLEQCRARYQFCFGWCQSVDGY